MDSVRTRACRPTPGCPLAPLLILVALALAAVGCGQRTITVRLVGDDLLGPEGRPVEPIAVDLVGVIPTDPLIDDTAEEYWTGQIRDYKHRAGVAHTLEFAPDTPDTLRLDSARRDDGDVWTNWEEQGVTRVLVYADHSTAVGRIPLETEREWLVGAARLAPRQHWTVDVGTDVILVLDDDGEIR